MTVRPERILVAGIGNIFLGDDAFGVEVARRLRDAPLPAGVEVADWGIRGMHLAYALADYDAAILVDAVGRGGRPGTLYVIEPDMARSGGETGAGAAPADAHSLTPAAVLALVQRIGGAPERVLIVGCEPASVEEGMELSEPVAASVGPAADLVLETIARMRRDVPRQPASRGAAEPA